MKKLIYLSAVLIILAAACQKQENKFKIEGTINGLKNQYVYLNKAGDKEENTIDSVKSENGKFSFAGTITTPNRYFITFEDMNAEVTFFNEASDISINGHIDSLKKTTVTGSQTQKVYEKYQKRLNQLREQQRDIYYKYQEARKQNEKKKVKLYENQYRQLDSIRRSYSNKFIEDHPASVVSAYIANRFAYTYELPELKKTVNNFDPSIKNAYYVNQLEDRIRKLESTKVGKTAPDFTMKNTDGKEVSLSDFRGKYVLLDFWASWCAPCRAENPNVVKAFNKYNDQGFTVLGVSLDRNRDNWLKAIEEDSLTWSHVSDLEGWNNRVSDKYGVMSIPQNYLLDEDGVIVAKNLRGEALQEKLAEVFKE